MSDSVAPGSLKLVSGWSPQRSLAGELREALLAHAGETDVRQLHGDTFLVHIDADAATVRDWLAPVLADGESVFVVEFERWSGRGPAVDRSWLLRRGH